MPRYFFHVTDGESIRDDTGTELSGLPEARRQALQTAGEMLRDGDGRFWTGQEWSMHVIGEDGREILVLKFSAEQMSPAG